MRYRKGWNTTLVKEDIPCYYPLIEELDHIYAHYPNSTLLFVTRDEEHWLNSVMTYHEGFILEVWKQCQTGGFPSKNATLADFKSFYAWHKGLIREFARSHPTITYLEIPLEADNTGQMLEEFTGVGKNCWGHYNQQRRSSPK